MLDTTSAKERNKNKQIFIYKSECSQFFQKKKKKIQDLEVVWKQTEQHIITKPLMKKGTIHAHTNEHSILYLSFTHMYGVSCALLTHMCILMFFLTSGKFS